ncbi:carbohydrate binding family 9 domain-containing protein [Mucilaginibacter sp. BJC16-A38]|uniref:carbohydrate binding family 9 domain-containing protein n=1 Tax=Mucilaginibacter phenanthrenivorans TaxID=1234842 RepID=UPI002157B019|nr:carbohydrate binding family 9 domain-containing protein [Mucilaginibacter phenanthrenivorans]MCR8560710.1 carbohydrate binding family 9 domain-containing protein [Mucilaginibacter phenanthrenivorans]
MKFRPLLAICLLFCLNLLAQKKNSQFKYHIHRLTSAVKIDGIMDEPAWQDVEVAGNFRMVLPMDTSFAKVKTEVRMAYDDKNVYILAICYKAFPGQSMVESLKRDFSFLKNDNFIFFMDTYNDQTNGYSFGSNAVGAEWDGTMYEGGKVDLSWTNKWVSAVKDYPDKYIFEASIPFKSIRYKKGISEWGINFSRNDLRTTEKSSWTPVPRQFPTASLAYTGTLVWDTPPPDPGPNIAIVPYLLTGVTKDYANHKNAVFHVEAGGDAKIAISSALNLDLTVHPDFSQVDADKQVTNLSRYELFYPETRQFFLENGDQFNNFGYASIRPFFSRRIGLTSTIIGGARLSGKLDQNWRISIMDMQTNSNQETGVPAQNFTMIALQRKIFARSNIGFLFVNKQSFNYPPSASATPADTKYNSNFGLEYNIASSDNLLTGKVLALKSFSPDKKGHDFTQAGNLQFANKYWAVGGQYEVVGANYNAGVGYVPRQGYIKLNPYIGYLFFPTHGAILSHGPQLNLTDYYDGSFNPTDNRAFLSYLITFRNKSTLTGLVERDYVKLLQPYDPTNYTGSLLPVGLQSTWHNVEISYFSIPQRLFTYDFTLDYGGYYDNGKKISVANDVGYRFQPYVNIQVNTTYNNLQLPQPWGNKAFWLVGPRVDVTMTNKFFLTGFFQYNQQGKNININTRLQWRYRPASDFFIVYTDNYLPRPLFVKNRGLVFKFTYWLNN